MCRKKKKVEETYDTSNKKAVPRVVFRVLNNCRPTPVAPEADEIQIGPINIPIAIHPYATRLEQEGEFDEEYEEE